MRNLLIFVASIFLLLGCNDAQQQPEVMIISADGNYTHNVLYKSIEVLSPKGEVNGNTFSFSGTLNNKGIIQVGELKLVIDFYNENHMAFYQCMHNMDKPIEANSTLIFEGICEGLSKEFVDSYKEFRIVVSKQ